jgi:hypothetical protein
VPVALGTLNQILSRDQLIFVDYLLTEKFAAKRCGFSGASSGGRNPAEHHPIPIHPLGCAMAASLDPG